MLRLVVDAALVSDVHNHLAFHGYQAFLEELRACFPGVVELSTAAVDESATASAILLSAPSASFDIASYLRARAGGAVPARTILLQATSLPAAVRLVESTGLAGAVTFDRWAQRSAPAGDAEGFVGLRTAARSAVLEELPPIFVQSDRYRCLTAPGASLAQQLARYAAALADLRLAEG